MESSAADLVVDDLTVEYLSNGYRVRPLDGLSMRASDGELVVVHGPSGCGKTTLLSVLAGLLSPTAGTVSFAGRKITGLPSEQLLHHRRHRVGVVFQAFNLVPSLTALENVAAPLLLTGVPRRESMSRAAALLDRVGLADRATHRPKNLSGGQQQRVAIARALVHDPPLLLADEPTAHLDHVQVESVLSLLRELAEPGRLVIVVTHDDRFSRIADVQVALGGRAPRASVPATEVTLQAGEVLFRQGEHGDLVYVVRAGALEIVREMADEADQHLHTCRRDEFVGELAALTGLPRSATVRALEPTVLTAFGVAEFRRHQLESR